MSLRQKEAIERQAEYDKLTLEQKLERLDRKPGKSAKQRAKLAKLIAARDGQQAKPDSRVQKFVAKQAIAKRA
jgi:hypothetical protein